MTERLHDFRNRLLVGDVSSELRRLPPQSLHCVVTSPPYFRLRDYQVQGQIGLENSGEEYLKKLVDVMKQVRRVLRRDGTVWLNMGDSYVGGGRGTDTGSTLEGSLANQAETRKVSPRTGIFGLKAKQLIGMPWRLALALQADGWWLRQDNIWHKKNVMPESCRDRSTRTHEYVFQLTRSDRYYYDAIAVEEPQSEHERSRRLREQKEGLKTEYTLRRDDAHGQLPPSRSGAARTVQARQRLAMKGTRNRRSVWSLGTQAFPEAHFATFPEKLVEPCVLASTSEKGCCGMCGAPLVRILKRKFYGDHNKARQAEAVVGHNTSGAMGNDVWYDHYVPAETVGWKKSCSCTLGDVVPCVVLDPFMGSGTTAVVSERLGRGWLGVELNPDYAAMATRRIERAREKRAAAQAKPARRPRAADAPATAPN
jgi:DNA modification methylase